MDWLKCNYTNIKLLYSLCKNLKVTIIVSCQVLGLLIGRFVQCKHQCMQFLLLHFCNFFNLTNNTKFKLSYNKLHKDCFVYIQLGRMRYATVSEFRGRKMVNIREFYDADGELRPGKKG